MGYKASFLNVLDAINQNDKDAISLVSFLIHNESNKSVAQAQMALIFILFRHFFVLIQALTSLKYQLQPH